MWTTLPCAIRWVSDTQHVVNALFTDVNEWASERAQTRIHSTDLIVSYFFLSLSTSSYSTVDTKIVSNLSHIWNDQVNRHRYCYWTTTKGQRWWVFFSWFMNEMRFKRNWNVRIMSFFIQIVCAFLGGKIIRLSEIVRNQFSTIILA